jgi:hypothetical protein
MSHQIHRRSEDHATPFTPRRLTSIALFHILCEELVHPACVPAFTARILEVEAGHPDVLGDVLDVDSMAMADPEVQRAVGPGTSADAAAPLTKDAIQAVWDGIAVGGGEMLANDDLVDGDVLIAVIDHATYDRGRGGVGDYLPVRQREGWCCCTSSGAKRRCWCRIGWVERDGRITTMSWLEAPAMAVMIGAAFVSEHGGRVADANGEGCTPGTAWCTACVRKIMG